MFSVHDVVWFENKNGRDAKRGCALGYLRFSIRSLMSARNFLRKLLMTLDLSGFLFYRQTRMLVNATSIFKYVCINGTYFFCIDNQSRNGNGNVCQRSLENDLRNSICVISY